MLVNAKLTDGREFQCGAGISLLDAATSAGVSLPYSCRTGRCSSCKAKVVSGTTSPMIDELGLSSSELSEGWILTCVRTAQSDLELETEYLGDVIIPVPKTFPCRISHMEYLAPDVLWVTLRLPPTLDFTFIAGQYIDVIGPNGVRRSYSLASSGLGETAIELHIREVESGSMSDCWFNKAKENDLLRINGPLGTFFLRDIAGIDVIFLATGTGIAPVKSMLESMVKLPLEGRPKSVTVLWGGRHLQDVYLDVAALPGEHVFIPVQSRPGKDWSGAIGYVQNVLLSLAPDLNNAVVYACGSDAMIQSAKVRLFEEGLPSARFYSDAFVTSGNY